MTVNGMKLWRGIATFRLELPKTLDTGSRVNPERHVARLEQLCTCQLRVNVHRRVTKQFLQFFARIIGITYRDAYSLSRRCVH